MKVCILGIGLTSLTLAKTLVNQGIYVDLFTNKKKKIQNKTRTIGITNANLKFFNKNVLNIQKLLWDIKKIEVYSYKLKNTQILNFGNNKERIFSMIKNFELFNHLMKELKKSRLFNLKIKVCDHNFLQKNYSLVFNCDIDHQISKHLFNKKILKDYKSFAHTTVISHKKVVDNNTASQIFTKNGPLAFLPISQTKTSIVYSCRGNKKIDLVDTIKEYNTRYKVLSIDDYFSFELKSSNLRNYYNKNILAFGDLLHKIHPLAGQGFNMSIRDIEEILKLVKSKIENGLDLDHSICQDFEKKTKHNNHIFTTGIDFIYEFFNLESQMNTNILSKSLKIFGNNPILKSFFSKFADRGIVTRNY